MKTSTSLIKGQSVKMLKEMYILLTKSTKANASEVANNVFDELVERIGIDACDKFLDEVYV